MIIKYKLLGNGTGIILTRQPDVASGNLQVVFEGAPENATVIFDIDGKCTYYRSLSNGVCEIPSENGGVIKVCVAVLEGRVNQKWICEEITAKETPGGILYAPNDMNLQSIIVELRLDNQDLRDQNRKFRAELDKIIEKYERLTEGYDFT